MKNTIFTKRQAKAIKLMEDVEVLLLEVNDNDYRKHLKHLRQEAIKIIRIEQSKGLMQAPKQKVNNGQ